MDNTDKKEPNIYIKTAYILAFGAGIFSILGAIGIIQKGYYMSAIIPLSIAIALMTPAIKMRSKSKRKLDIVKEKEPHATLEVVSIILMIVGTYLMLIAIGLFKQDNNMFPSPLLLAIIFMLPAIKMQSDERLRKNNRKQREKAYKIRESEATTISPIPTHHIGSNNKDGVKKIKMQKKLDVLEKDIKNNRYIFTLYFPMLMAISSGITSFYKRGIRDNPSLSMEALVKMGSINIVISIIGFLFLYLIFNAVWKNKVRKAKKLQRKLMET